MAKNNQKTAFHELLISNGVVADVLTIILTAHEAELKSITDSKNGEIETLKTEHSTAIETLKTTHETAIGSLQEFNQELESKVEELSSKVDTIQRVTPGTYKAKDKKVYKFDDGVMEFVFCPSGSAHAVKFETKEAIKDAALMEELIFVQAGFIVEVKS